MGGWADLSLPRAVLNRPSPMVGGGGPVMDGWSRHGGKNHQPAGFQRGGEPDPTAGQLPGPRKENPRSPSNCATERHCCGGGQTLTWTRITDPDEAANLLPAWFGSRMSRLRGRFGLVLTTGDTLRITSIGALHQSSSGIILLDVLLDHGGIPDGIDLSLAIEAFSRRARSRGYRYHGAG